jgi:uncharacterized repeat protein (TIGR01451 family)
VFPLPRFFTARQGLISPTRRRNASPGRPRCRPGVEALEDRVVPAPLTPEATGFVGIDPGHNVEFRKDGIGLGSIPPAVALFQLPTSGLSAQGFDNGIPYIHYLDTGSTANNNFPPAMRDVSSTGNAFGGGSIARTTIGSFLGPNVEDDNFAMLSTGYILIQTTGTWNFQVASDDGFDLQIGGQEVNYFNGGRGYQAGNNNNPGPNAVISTPGLYKYSLLWFQGAGGAQCDFYATSPAGGAPILVGDTADGGLPVFQGEAMLTKSGPASVLAGTNLSYSLSLTTQIPTGFNDQFGNNLSVTNVTLSAKVADVLPTNTTFQSFTAPAGWSVTAPAVGGTGTVSASIASMTPGSASFTLTVNVTGGTSLSNTGTFSDNSGDMGSSNTVTTTVNASADVAIQMSAPAAGTATGNVTYTITITNNGPSPAQNVTLSDALPANSTFVSQSQTGGPNFTLSNTATSISDTIASLAVGAKATFSLTISVGTKNQGNTISNTATVSSPTPDPNPANNSATAQTAISPILVFATGADAGGVALVNVYDGATGAFKFSLAPFGFLFRGGVRVAVADITGSGVPDIICAPGPGGGPLIQVYDGLTSALIRTFYAFGTPSPAGTVGPGVTGNIFNPKGGFLFTGGLFVAAGDITGSGHADILIGADAGTSPQVEIVDGLTLQVLGNFMAFSAPSFRGGVRVAAGDVNGDGRADIICGAGPGGGPLVVVYDGATLSALYSLFPFGVPSFSGGVYVAAGILNGHTDIIVGAGPTGGPQVQAYDGTNQALIANFFGLAPGFTGGIRVGAATTNFSGSTETDIFMVAGPGGGPQVEVFSGLTFAPLTSFFAYPPSFNGGVFVS